MDKYIKGSVRNVFYRGDNGYIIGLFKVKDTSDENLKQYLNKSITFTGSFFDLKEANDYLFFGELITHPRYGKQYKVNRYELILPESKNGIIAFLSSSLFKGVGLKLATKIVDTLGDKALDKIVLNYQSLLLVPSITEKKANLIYEVLNKERESYQTIVYLQKIGFKINEATKVYHCYKEQTMSVIEDNIYQLLDNIEGIGFITVDKIASVLGIKEDDEERLKACLFFIMEQLCLKNGHTYNKKEDLYLALNNYLNFNLDLDKFNNYLVSLAKLKKIIIEDDKYYLETYYQAEMENAFKIASLIQKDDVVYDNLDSYLSKLAKRERITYNQQQLRAIKKSLTKNFLIITGGPGTGKTTIIKAIANLYCRLNKSNSNYLALLAPTGRAAKRLKEATNFEALTIHKFLKWNKELNEFAVNKFNKANTKYVIIDEVSMIDNFLLYHLFNGLNDQVKMVLIGDYYQLPSVGPGQVLKDLIESNQIPIVELKQLYRQQKKSYIISLAYEIKNNKLSNEYKNKQDDYNFVTCSKLKIANVIKQLCEKALVKGFDYRQIQVLIPMYKGLNGIDNINKLLQTVFNPKDDSKDEIIHQGFNYRVGDKVLQVKNNNDLGISNGEIGIIKRIFKEERKDKILIDFDGEQVIYSLKNFDDLRLGYAISIHKAQGSEFEIVIIPLEQSFKRMLYNKLIYTAITRAKKSLMLVGELEAFESAVSNIKEAKRQTALKERLTKILTKV